MSDHHHRLAWTGIIAAIVLAGALLALNFPVFLDSYDQYGFQIKCGTGYLSDLTQATAIAGDADYVDQCETALLTRRLWTIPLALLGGAALLAALVASATTSARESLQPHHHNA
ncbi:hypothetical protein [Mycolicibacterium celeriflavum]|uniref:hypothetical protein n=1 Tax=Mycolicibacterium celeriflavum TaxID=1249101 RepID=UPI003CF73AE1